jgi:hypothetical protein
MILARILLEKVQHSHKCFNEQTFEKEATFSISHAWTHSLYSARHYKPKDAYNTEVREKQ